MFDRIGENQKPIHPAVNGGFQFPQAKGVSFYVLGSHDYYTIEGVERLFVFVND